MKLIKLQITLEGATALIMHNGRTRDPDNEYSRRKDELTRSRNKTPEIRTQISRVEFEAGLYWDDEVGLYIPSENLQTAFIKAAKKIKEGRRAVAFLIDTPLIPFQSPQPKSIEKMWADPRYVFKKCVVQQQTAIVRTRPRISLPWSISFTARLDTELMEVETAARILEIAGKLEGLMDWRPGAPRMPGNYGTFTHTVEDLGEYTL